MLLLNIIEGALVILNIYYYTTKCFRRQHIYAVQEAGFYLKSVYGKFFQKEFSFALYHVESGKFLLYTYDMSNNLINTIGATGDYQPGQHYYDIRKQTFLTLPSKPTLDIANEAIKFNGKRETIHLNFINRNITINTDKNILEFRQKHDHTHNGSRSKIICSAKEKGTLFPVTMGAYKQFYGTPSTETNKDSTHRFLYFQCNVDGTIQLKRCPHGFNFSIAHHKCVGSDNDVSQ